MLQDELILKEYRQKGAGWTDNAACPFLYNTDRLFANDVLINEFYGRGLREYLAFDEETKLSSGCCSMLPAPDEQVFHYQSFITDLPKKHMAWGGAKLVPSKSAELLKSSGGGLPPGTKIALVTGRATPHRIQSYKEAFTNHSFVVRTIVGQSSIQDFCFLAHARAGLWGTVHSSYANWASILNTKLGNATLYGVNYPSREVNVTGRVVTNEELARMVRYPVLDVSDEDVW